MKKTLLSFFILSLVTSASFAQSNVSIYGVADISYAKMSGSDWQMNSNHSSRLGFKGYEDLGGGNKVHFRVEKRFDLENGTNGSTGTANYRGQGTSSSNEFTGVSYIGFSGDWGVLYLGRVDDYVRDTVSLLDPFEEDSIGSFLYTPQIEWRRNNALRYDSPRLNGFQAGLMYMLGKNTKSGGDLAHGSVPDSPSKHRISNDGIALGINYENYGLTGIANFERAPDSDRSFTWNLGLGYKMGPARISLLYEKTHNKGYGNGTYQWVLIDQVGTPSNSAEEYAAAVKSSQDSWMLALTYDTGPGDFITSLQYTQLDKVKHLDGSPVLKTLNKTATTDKADILKYAMAYNYHLSKRTDIYVIAAYMDFDNNMAGRLLFGTERDNMLGFQIGLNHRF